jgi:hypothetical protein
MVDGGFRDGKGREAVTVRKQHFELHSVFIIATKINMIKFLFINLY